MNENKLIIVIINNIIHYHISHNNSKSKLKINYVSSHYFFIIIKK